MLAVRDNVRGRRKNVRGDGSRRRRSKIDGVHRRQRQIFAKRLVDCSSDCLDQRQEALRHVCALARVFIGVHGSCFRWRRHAVGGCFSA